MSENPADLDAVLDDAVEAFDEAIAALSHLVLIPEGKAVLETLPVQFSNVVEIARTLARDRVSP